MSKTYKKHRTRLRNHENRRTRKMPIGSHRSGKTFLYNPNDKNKSFDVYIDKNPDDTIPIKYSTIDDVNDTIRKLERLYKNRIYPHKRIWQVGMIMKVRLEAIYKRRYTKYKNAKDVSNRYKLAKRYFEFLSHRTKMDEKDRRNRRFII